MEKTMRANTFQMPVTTTKRTPVKERPEIKVSMPERGTTGPVRVGKLLEPLRQIINHPERNYLMAELFKDYNLHEYAPPERERYRKLADSYESGKIYRLMKRIGSKSHYKNLPAALDRYIPGNEFERALIDIFREGLQFTGEDTPSIMSYGYDPLDDRERDEYPVEMDRMIRVIYDRNDLVTEHLEDWTNTELGESYDISPATWFAISPLTAELFSMDRYPDDFSNWFTKLCILVA
jgi:hypothetical protein